MVSLHPVFIPTLLCYTFSMPTLYIMCGIAFSGKSTLARKIAVRTGSVRIAFDELWVEKDKEKPVPKDAEGWKFIRKVGQEEINKALKNGQSVVYDDNNVRFEHREELRKLASGLGANSVVVYLNTPLELIRKREIANKSTKERHSVETENFQKVLEQLEVPTPDENVIEFKSEMAIDEWLGDLDDRF